MIPLRDHLIGNMLYLWIFGHNIEAVSKHVGFAVFYGVGARGAIAGVLARTWCSSRARTDVLTYNRIVPLPAVVVLGFWILIQFLNGIAALGPQAAEAGVAWWAHIGGFIAGVVIALVFRGRPAALQGDARAWLDRT